ncbi:MAG: hypothetical protein ACRC1M_06705 [Methanobacteriaceae archaeon]
MALFGYKNVYFSKDKNPIMKCWRTQVYSNYKKLKCFLFMDPCSAEIVAKEIKKALKFEIGVEKERISRRYIKIELNGKFSINKRINGKTYRFGTYSHLDDAKVERDRLVKCNWDEDVLCDLYMVIDEIEKVIV